MAPHKKRKKAPKKSFSELPCLILILSVSLFMRIEPFLATPGRPYGAEDAAYHFQMARMVSEGADMRQCYNCLNYDIYQGIYGYPPLTHFLPGLISRLSTINIRYVIFPINALFSTALVFFIYLLSRKLFGPYPALASAAFLAAGYREIWSIYIGEWSDVYGMVFIPLAFLILLDLKKKPYLLPAFATTLGFAIMAYPQAAIFIVLVSASYFALVERLNVRPKDLLVPAAILLILAYPTYYYSEGVVRLLKWEKNTTPFSVTNLLSPYTPYIGGIPQAFKEFFTVYTYAIIPLLVAGGYFLIRDRRKPEAMFILMLLFWQYILTHSDTLGFGTGERALRTINQEGLIFALAAGFVFSRIGDDTLKAVMIASLSLLVVYNLYSLSFPSHWLLPEGFGRPTENELSAFLWVKENTPENATFIRLGGSHSVTGEWATALTQRRFLTITEEKYYFGRAPVEIEGNTNLYAILDNNFIFAKPADRKYWRGWLRKKYDYLKAFSTSEYTNNETMIMHIDLDKTNQTAKDLAKNLGN